MRRTDREVPDRLQIDEIIRSSLVCHIAMSRDDRPYVLPFSFGYVDGRIYIHTAGNGAKIDYFTTNPNVAFCFESNVELVSSSEPPCNWSFKYQSVAGQGSLAEVTMREERIHALEAIVSQYGRSDHVFSDEDLKKLRVWRIEIQSVSGKSSLPKDVG
jgi:nitroimidazol reductase NimA-like FMN-containing flavoprotein (pyridoxamine 5'-phosphate oxidase superfamily)